MVIWKVKLSNGQTIAGSPFDKSSDALRQRLSKENLKIVSLKLKHQNGKEALTLDNAQDYFIGQKLRMDMGSHGNILYAGVGATGPEGKIKINWFLAHNMEHSEEEYRTQEKCGFFLLKNS